MKIDKDILKIIESGTSAGRYYKLPLIQLDRKIYLEVNKVLELLGGKWDKRFKSHWFPNSIGDAIDSVFLTGEVKDIKKELQFFETPSELAKLLIERAEVREGMYCLEPSAGKGNIAGVLADVAGKGNVVCWDINEEFVEILREKGFRAEKKNFMDMKARDYYYCLRMNYDQIVMNPPFTRQQDIDHVLHALDFLVKGEF